MRMNRRDLLALLQVIGAQATFAGGGMLNKARAQQLEYGGPLRLEGDPRGTRVVILGAGLAGLTAAYELNKAGYQVQVLEFNTRVGGRSWTLRGGDTYTQLGGEAQHCEFAPGVYMNPGPWRVSHMHRAFLGYCQQFGVAVEPFIQFNTNGFVQVQDLLDGRRVRQREVTADFNGYVSELLARCLASEDPRIQLPPEEARLLRGLLRSWGGLDGSEHYVTGPGSSRMRGIESFDDELGSPVYSQPLQRADMLKLATAAAVMQGTSYPGMAEFQMPLFQPVGGMDMLPRAFAKRVQHLIRFNCRVVAMTQDDREVAVEYENLASDSKREHVTADWCLCTIPLSIVSQMDLRIDPQMKAGIDSVFYNSEVKIGLQFKRRFWEQDDAIYGGFSLTDLPIRQIGYPSYGLNSPGPGLLYGTLMHTATYAFEFTGMSPAEQIARTVEQGAKIHPQYRSEFENGMAVAWHRNPHSLGCTAQWTDDLVRLHYQNLRNFSGRFALCGESIAVKGWQDGAIMSALDQTRRLHARVMGTKL
jgi:monoamine oxidase